MVQWLPKFFVEKHKLQLGNTIHSQSLQVETVELWEGI